MKNNEIRNYKKIGDNYYEWCIDDWNKLEHLEWSPIFMAGGYKW